MGACSDTFIASNASVGIDYANVFVERQRNFSENVFGAGRNTFPAGNTIVRIDGNIGRCHALL